MNKLQRLLIAIKRELLCFSTGEEEGETSVILTEDVERIMDLRIKHAGPPPRPAHPADTDGREIRRTGGE